MPFWLHQPKTILVINGISFKKKLFILLGVCLCILGGWYGLYNAYVKKMLYHKQHKYSDLLGQQSLFSETSKRYEVIEQEHKQLSLQFDALAAKQASLQKTIAQLLSFMKDKGLVCHSIKPIKKKNKDLYKKHYFLLEGKGDFRQFLRMLGDDQKISSLISIKSLVVQKAENDTVSFKAMIRLLQVG